MRYQVKSPIKFQGVVYRSGTVDLPESIGAQAVKDGQVEEAPNTSKPTKPASKVDGRPDSTVVDSEPVGGTDAPSADPAAADAPAEPAAARPARKAAAKAAK